MQKVMALATVLMICSVNSVADMARSSFDITGTWQFASGGTANFFQSGNKIYFIDIDPNFSHYFVGKYISPTKIEGAMNRVNRHNDCSTESRVTVTIVSPDEMSVSLIALDSKCDLEKNKSYFDSAKRLQ